MNHDIAAQLREPFAPEKVGKLPKIWCGACSKVAKERRACEQNGHIRKVCGTCKNNITTAHIHVSYVGHAEVTDRLLSVDPEWTWEPMAFGEDGLPVMTNGGLWIRLTVGGMTRIGYGDASGKTGGDAVKEAIGDCLITGTPVRTGEGWQPIETVKIGQMVPTRQGWRTVTDHWLSADAAPVLAVLLDNGRILVATPGHKVPTTRGVSSVGALRNGDMLYAWPDTARLWAPRTYVGTAAHTAGCRPIPNEADASTTWRPRHRAVTCTETSTRLTTGLSPTAGTYTIATTILATTAPTTWSPSRHPNTPGIITVNVGRVSTGAIAAASSSNPPNTHGTSAGAVPGVRRPREGRPDWSGLDSARRNHPWHCGAPNAVGVSRAPSRGPNTAGPRVVAVLDAGTAPVWNLSVEDIHEYVANGLFVHNSIRNAAMRFGVALDLWRKEPAGDGDPVPSTKAKEGSSEVVSLKTSIVAVAKTKGLLSVPEIEADFTAWSHNHGQLKDAPLPVLAEYLGALRRRENVS